jgi:alkanesulfonate monooxygenase SsuD/methylene tetrahydromethanopterin reductase-like flavin-dependent oxidoreductase (luciferase family)
MGAPRIGYLPTGFGSSGSHGTRRLVELTEQAGLDHLAVGDHVSFYGGLGFDGLLSAASVLACSDRLSTNTGVYLLPLRHPVLVARQLADLALVAPGRLTFGVGIGGEDPHEVEVCGVDPTTRGRRMDECIRILRGLLTGEAVDHDSEFFHLDDARIVPAPAQPIPIVVGGRSDAAISRAGRLGDGWFGIWVSASRYGQVVTQVQEAAAAADREDVPSQHALNVWCGVGNTSDEARSHVAPAMQAFYQLPYERFEKWSPAGTPEQIAEFLLPYAAAGCSTFNLILNGPSPEAEIEACAEVRDRILAGVA